MRQPAMSCIVSTFADGDLASLASIESVALSRAAMHLERMSDATELVDRSRDDREVLIAPRLEQSDGIVRR